MHTREKGSAGEDMAAEHLLSQGYKIERRNYFVRNGEIDIIAIAPDGTYVFVEVKSANTKKFGNPLLKVTLTKQRTIIKIAQNYMYRHNIKNKPYRFDVIGIYNGKIDHIKNAFFMSQL